MELCVMKLFVIELSVMEPCVMNLRILETVITGLPIRESCVMKPSSLSALPSSPFCPALNCEFKLALSLPLCTPWGLAVFCWALQPCSELAENSSAMRAASSCCVCYILLTVCTRIPPLLCPSNWPNLAAKKKYLILWNTLSRSSEFWTLMTRVTLFVIYFVQKPSYGAYVCRTYLMGLHTIQSSFFGLRKT